MCQTGLSRHLSTSTSGHSKLRAERQSARLSKITNDGLTGSGVMYADLNNVETEAVRFILKLSHLSSSIRFRQ